MFSSSSILSDSANWFVLSTWLGSLLLVIGVGYGVLRRVRSKPSANFLSALVAFAASSALCNGVAGMSLSGHLDARAWLGTVLVGVINLVGGILLFTSERRLANFDPGLSPGLLSAGVGVLALVIAVIIPTLPVELAPSPPLAGPAQAISANADTPTRSILPTRTPFVTLTPSPLPTLTLTPTHPATLTPAPTNGVPILPTSVQPSATPTVTLVACTVTVIKNVNLRQAPAASEALILTVPSGTALSVSGRSQDKSWWRVTYQEKIGWVNADFVVAETNCKLIPTVTP